jgi:hypothetical protein
VGPFPFDAGHSPSFSLWFFHEKSLQDCARIWEGQRPTLLPFRATSSLPPLLVIAGWRAEASLDARVTLSGPASEINRAVRLWRAQAQSCAGASQPSPRSQGF